MLKGEAGIYRRVLYRVKHGQQDHCELFMRALLSEAKRFADTVPMSLLFMGNPNTNKTQ